MQCPCKIPDDASKSYPCPLITELSGVKTTMNRHWCMLYKTRKNYRKAWNDARGPGQAVPDNNNPTRKTNRAVVPPEQGPGTELLKLFKMPVTALRWLNAAKTLFRERKKGCSDRCKVYARQMNAWGVAGCRKRMDEIVDHLEAEAKEAKIQFDRRVAILFVRIAIRIAEKKMSSEFVARRLI